jgi:hypothetical protein
VREERKNSISYSLLRLGLHYNDTQILFIGKHNGPNIWANDLYGHPLIIFITPPLDVHRGYASLKPLLEKPSGKKF